MFRSVPIGGSLAADVPDRSKGEFWGAKKLSERDLPAPIITPMAERKTLVRRQGT